MDLVFIFKIKFSFSFSFFFFLLIFISFFFLIFSFVVVGSFFVGLFHVDCEWLCCVIHDFVFVLFEQLSFY